MGVSTLFVLCTVILFAICEETTNQEADPATALIDTRFKRETEVDSHIREKTTTLPLGAMKKPIIPLVPVTKSLSPFSNSPNVILRKRKLVPLVHKRPISSTNTTEVKTNEHFNVTHQDDNSKMNSDIEINEIIKPIEKTQTIDTSTLDKNESSNIEKKNIETKENPVLAPEIVTEENMKNETAEISTEEKETISTKGMKTPILNVVETSLPECLLTKFNTYRKIKANPIPPSERIALSERIAHKPVIIAKESRENSVIPTEMRMLTKPVNNVTNHSKIAGVSAEVSIGSNSLPMLAEPAKTLVPIIKQLQTPLSMKPITKVPNRNSNDSADFNLGKNIEDENNRMQIKKEPDAAIKSLIIEPEEEIVIQNNNYEELFESSPAPQYSSPKLITSELCPAQSWNNFTPIPSAYEKCNVPTRYNEFNNYNIPYSYDVKKYNGKYIVDTYDKLRNKNDNSNFNKALYNGNQWNRQNSHYQPQDSFNNFYQGQGYSNRIWRSWRNNQIIIRPKSSDAMISKKLPTRYLANTRNMPVYSARTTSPTAYENQNMSPYLPSISFQLRNRYGY